MSYLLSKRCLVLFSLFFISCFRVQEARFDSRISHKRLANKLRTRVLECLKPSSSSDPHFISLNPQQPSLNALGCLVGTFWRWIFPESQQHSRLIYHCVEQIRAISCHTLLPCVRFMCNSSKKHFRSKFGKEEGTHGISRRKGRTNLVCSWLPGEICRSSPIWAGAKGQQRAKELCHAQSYTCSSSCISVTVQSTKKCNKGSSRMFSISSCSASLQSSAGAIKVRWNCSSFIFVQA